MTAVQLFQDYLTQTRGITLASSGVLDDLLRNYFGERVRPISQL